jgi:hypothetical protein
MSLEPTDKEIYSADFIDNIWRQHRPHSRHSIRYLQTQPPTFHAPAAALPVTPGSSVHHTHPLADFVEPVFRKSGQPMSHPVRSITAVTPGLEHVAPGIGLDASLTAALSSLSDPSAAAHMALHVSALSQAMTGKRLRPVSPPNGPVSSAVPVVSGDSTLSLLATSVLPTATLHAAGAHHAQLDGQRRMFGSPTRARLTSAHGPGPVTTSANTSPARVPSAHRVPSRAPVPVPMDPQRPKTPTDTTFGVSATTSTTTTSTSTPTLATSQSVTTATIATNSTGRIRPPSARPPSAAVVRSPSAKPSRGGAPPPPDLTLHGDPKPTGPEGYARLYQPTLIWFACVFTPC